VIFGWDIHDQLYSRELLVSNRNNGYRDLLARVDLTTYRRIPWEFNVPFFLVSFFDPVTKESLSVCPRGTLAKVMADAAQNGWQCMAGAEYEVGHGFHALRVAWSWLTVLQYFQFKGGYFVLFQQP
jgi:glutamine synthetase